MTHTFIFLLLTSLSYSGPAYPLADWTSSLRYLIGNSNVTCHTYFLITHYPFPFHKVTNFKNMTHLLAFSYILLTNNIQMKT